MRGLSTVHRSVTCGSMSGQLADQEQGEWTSGKGSKGSFLFQALPGASSSSLLSLILRVPQQQLLMAVLDPKEKRQKDKSSRFRRIYFFYLLCCKGCFTTEWGSGLAILQTTVKQGHQPHGEMGGETHQLDRKGRKPGISKNHSNLHVKIWTSLHLFPDLNCFYFESHI